MINSLNLSERGASINDNPYSLATASTKFVKDRFNASLDLLDIPPKSSRISGCCSVQSQGRKCKILRIEFYSL